MVAITGTNKTGEVVLSARLTQRQYLELINLILYGREDDPLDVQLEDASRVSTVRERQSRPLVIHRDRAGGKLICQNEICDGTGYILPYVQPNDRKALSPEEVARITFDRTGVAMCLTCYQKRERKH